MTELDGFLDRERTRGNTDSSGVFTVSVEKARHKLGQGYDWTVPAYYLLRLVQSAVRLKASRIAVQLLRRRVRFSFWGPAEPELFPARVLDRLVSSELPTSGPQAHFQPALLSVTAGQIERFAYHCSQAPSPQKLMFEGGEVFLQAQGGLGGEECRYTLEFQKKGGTPYGLPQTWRELRHQIFETGAEHWAITNRCAACPIPLKLDGRYLEPGLQVLAQPVDWFPQAGPFFLATQFEPGDGFQWKLPPTANPVPPHGSFLTEPNPDTWRTTVSECLLLACALSGPGQIHFFHDGVFLEPSFFDFGLQGASVFTTLGGLSTDISGMHVITDERFAQRAGVWDSKLQEMARQVLEHLSHLRAPSSTFGIGSLLRFFGFKEEVLGGQTLPALQNAEVLRGVQAHLIVATKRRS